MTDATTITTEGAMTSQNRYCCRCQRTTRFAVHGTLYTCSRCGVRVDVGAQRPDVRMMVGNPFRSYRVLTLAA